MKYKLIILFIVLVKCSVLLGQDPVFTDGKIFTYRAIYEDSINQIFTEDTIELIITDIPWKQQPDKQTTMIWKYHSRPDAIIKSKIFSIGWVDIDSTGFIENENNFFIHPPRHHQYSVTEIAPFPELQFPLEINKEYKKIIFIGSGWGEWSQLKLKFNYKVSSLTERSIGKDQYKCWMIQSTSTSELGQSKLDFTFSEEIGFIEMHYHIYNGIKIKFELIEIK